MSFIKEYFQEARRFRTLEWLLWVLLFPVALCLVIIFAIFIASMLAAFTATEVLERLLD